MTPRRLKLATIVWLLAASGLLMLAWTQEWISLRANDTPVTVAGDVAAPSLAALSLAGFALAGAIAIASPVFRVILGVLQTALGLTAALQSILTIAHPIAASTAAVTAATGIDGDASVASAVTAVTLSAWPWLALVAATAATLGGIGILAGARRWPGPTRRYQVARFEQATGAAAPLGDWDALSDGDDPTSR